MKSQVVHRKRPNEESQQHGHGATAASPRASGAAKNVGTVTQESSSTVILTQETMKTTTQGPLLDTNVGGGFADNTDGGSKSFCYGVICSALGIAGVIVLPVSITLIFMGVRGFLGMEKCDIGGKFALSLNTFNFLFGVLCLAVPVAFVLSALFDDSTIPKLPRNNCVKFCVKPLLVVYFIICVIATVAELVFSVYVATQVYGHFGMWQEEKINCSTPVFYSSLTSVVILHTVLIGGIVILLAVKVVSVIFKGLKLINTFVRDFFRAVIPARK